MPGFRRKLHLYVGERAVLPLARELGLDPSTLQKWLSGQSPTLAGVKELAEATGVPVSYWADDSVPERSLGDLRGVMEETVAYGARREPHSRARGATHAPLGLDAANPCVLALSDEAVNLRPGEAVAVVYDADSSARAGDGALAVAVIRGRPALKRVAGEGRSRVYLPPGGAGPALPAPAGDAREHPVVAVLTAPLVRRAHGAESHRAPSRAPR